MGRGKVSTAAHQYAYRSWGGKEKEVGGSKQESSNVIISVLINASISSVA